MLKLIEFFVNYENENRYLFVRMENDYTNLDFLEHFNNIEISLNDLIYFNGPIKTLKVIEFHWNDSKQHLCKYFGIFCCQDSKKLKKKLIVV